MKLPDWRTLTVQDFIALPDTELAPAKTVPVDECPDCEDKADDGPCLLQMLPMRPLRRQQKERRLLLRPNLSKVRLLGMGHRLCTIRLPVRLRRRLLQDIHKWPVPPWHPRRRSRTHNGRPDETTEGRRTAAHCPKDLTTRKEAAPALSDGKGSGKMDAKGEPRRRGGGPHIIGTPGINHEELPARAVVFPGFKTGPLRPKR